MTRHGLGELIPDASGLPLATFVVNTAGAFTLGLLVQLLAEAVPAPAPRHALGVLWGTGFLGAFTTYGGLAAGTVGIARDGRPIVAVTYALTTVLAGVAVAYLGVVVGGRTARRLIREGRVLDP